MDPQERRERLLRGDINWIRKHPKSPAPEAADTRLRKKNFRPVAAGARDGFIDRPGLLLGNLAPVSKDLNKRKAWARRRGNLKAGGSRAGKRIPGPAGAMAARDAKGEAVGRVERIQSAIRMTSPERIHKFGGARQRRVASTRVRREQHVFARNLE